MNNQARKLPKYAYNIEAKILGEDSRFEPRFSVVEISSHGDNLTELLANAEYVWLDQDGDELGCDPANDLRATNYIELWYRDNTTAEDRAEEAAEQNDGMKL